MFVRRKKNRSGSTSVVVVSKHSGHYKEIYTLGISSNPEEIGDLCQAGWRWIRQQSGLVDMFESCEQEVFEEHSAEYFFDNIENILLNGTQLILDPIFELIGFDKLNDPILKQLVISRICQPLSKSATVDYLKSHFDEDIELHKIYRYLDTLNSTRQDQIQQISVKHTEKILGEKIGLVFYDVTTLYFETDYPDELRKTGFSKDGRHSQPQIVLGLLVSLGGYPLAYAIHEGNKYEGHTMFPVINEFVKKFSLKDFVIVADAGLMNKENIKELEKNTYKYIIGARIKNESEKITSWLLSQEKRDGIFYEYQKSPKSRLIIGYSETRAKKDVYNRAKGVRRLEKEYQDGMLTKDKINKRGYNKFLEISDNITIRIDYDKIRDDAKWDGLKGYITNTNLSPATVHQQYTGLWYVERAFRITKGQLDLRPMFHFTKKRIEAHICICFVAYKIYKELERVLLTNGINLSVDKVLSIAKTIITIKLKLPTSSRCISKTMLLTDKHKSIAKLFEPNFWEKEYRNFL